MSYRVWVVMTSDEKFPLHYDLWGIFKSKEGAEHSRKEWLEATGLPELNCKIWEEPLNA